MGIFDKAKDFASKNPDKADQVVEKAGDMVDERTGGKYASHVDKGQDFARGQYGGGQGQAPSEAAPPAPGQEQTPGQEQPPQAAAGEQQPGFEPPQQDAQAQDQVPGGEPPAGEAPPAPEGERPM